MISVGITGTRFGCTDPQLSALTGALRDLRERWGAQELHHGDCVGVDLQAAAIATEHGYRTVCHPPDSDEYRGWHPSDEVLATLPFLVRNRAIVDACDVLIGCPPTDEEIRRGGTWYTIRYARTVERVKMLVIGPSGTVTESRGFTLAEAPSTSVRLELI